MFLTINRRVSSCFLQYYEPNKGFHYIRFSASIKMSSFFLPQSTAARDHFQFFLESLEISLINATKMSQDSLSSSGLSDWPSSDPPNPPSSKTGVTLSSDPPESRQTWDDVPQRYKAGDNAVCLATRQGTTRGWFWDYGFQVRRVKDNPKVIRWLCKVCSFAKRSPGDPYTLLATNPENVYKHLAGKHKIFSEDPEQAAKYKPRKLTPQGQPAIDAFTRKRKAEEAFEQSQIAQFDKAKFRRLIVNWLAETNLPFTAASSPALHAAFHYVNPQVTIQQAMPGSRAVRKQILCDYHKYKSRVIEALARSPGQVHIAFDGWTSRNRHGFFAINAQFLDSTTFEPKKILLNLPHMEGNHTGVNIAAQVTEVLREFGLVTNPRQLGYFTVDNASNNDTALAELSALKGIDGLNPLMAGGSLDLLAAYTTLWSGYTDLS